MQPANIDLTVYKGSDFTKGIQWKTGATPTPVETAAPAAKPAKATVKTISCVKGKITKKVTGANPKCPAGFKKK